MNLPCAFPEAILVSGDNRVFTVPLGGGKESLLTFTTMDVAAQSLKAGIGNGPVDAKTVIKQVSPQHWITIAKSIGPTLKEIMVVVWVDGENLAQHGIPIEEFLREARRRCEAELDEKFPIH